MRCCLMLVFVILLFLQSTLQAEVKTGFRQLGSTTPVAIQRGTKKVLNVRSNFTLDGAHSFFFDRPGIQVKFLETKPIAAPRRGRGRAGTPFRFEFDVPAKQPLGIYECRVATNIAVSSLTHLLVTDYPVIEEDVKKKNNTQQTAQKITVPVAICGTCERAEDVDFYQFVGKAGSTLTFNVYAQRVTEAVHSMQSGSGGYLMDAIITLYSPQGQVLAQNNNFYGGDPFLAMKLPEDGIYSIQIRDSRYIGNTKYVYCLEISDRPFAHSVFPLAVQRGKTVKAKLNGHHLGTTNNTTISTTSSSPLGWQQMPMTSANGITNPVEVFVSDDPQVVSSGKNLSLEKAMPIKVPVGVSGHFSVEGQKHYYSIDAKKGEYYLFHVESNRRQLPLDAVIEIFDAKGRSISKMDDGWHTKDPHLYFRAPADGKYTVCLYDLLYRGGERFYYHLNASRSGPDFEVHGEYFYAQLAPGTNMIWFAKITRRNGFTGEVEIKIDNLPKGVTYTPVTTPAGMTQVAVILSAKSNAKINASLVRLYGKATIKDESGKTVDLIRDGNVTCELQGQGGGQGRWPAKTQLVGVVEPLDLLKVTATPAEITLKPGETKDIKVRIIRKEGFKDPVMIATEFKYSRSVIGAQLPKGITIAPGSTARLAGKKLEGTITLVADKDPKKLVAVNKLPIAILARVSITFSITTNHASNPILLTVLPEK